jgi:ABC-type transporter Mla subunit MlaD
MSSNDKHEQLHDSLQNLQGALDQAKPATAQAQQAVDSLRQDVAGALDQPWAAHEHHFHSLRERLNHALAHLEMDHPELTLAIGEVLDNLAAIGV